MGEQSKKISLGALILMIFTTIFGFGNPPMAFQQMGYGAIFWFVIGAVLFFIPSGLMFAEYGATFKEAKGGIYSWIEGSLGETWAFIATFMWLASWIVWLVVTAEKIWITLSTVITGHDNTASWSFMGLSSTMTIGLCASLWIIFVTWATSRGMETLAKVSSVGGVAVMIMNGVLFLASGIILVANHGQLAQPIHHLSDFATSPSAQYQTPIALISFIVYAIFAYGGLEAMGGVTDSLDKPEKTFPKGMIIGALIVAVGYSLAIFLWGASANWHQIVVEQKANLGNITYIMMQNLGLQLGKALGLSASSATGLGLFFSRFSGLSMFLAYVGSFFVLTYSPLKSFIIGSPAELWPKKLTVLNKKGMPANAMWLQAMVIIFFIAGISILSSITHKDATFFYNVLQTMSNVATTMPYFFLIIAFPFFKAKKDLDRPFVIYKNHSIMMTTVVISLATVTIGMLFTCIEPFIEGDMFTGLWTIAGPVFFGLVAWIFLIRRNKNLNN